MNLFHSFRPLVVLLLAVGSVIFSASASAEERAYQSRSTALLNFETLEFVATGNATHLGKYTEVGSLLISGDDPTALDVEGSATLTAANDDELRVNFTGTLNFLTGTIVATITFDGAAADRFQDATGSGSLVAQFQADGTIAVVVDGTIDY